MPCSWGLKWSFCYFFLNFKVDGYCFFNNLRQWKDVKRMLIKNTNTRYMFIFVFMFVYPSVLSFKPRLSIDVIQKSIVEEDFCGFIFILHHLWILVFFFILLYFFFSSCCFYFALIPHVIRMYILDKEVKKKKYIKVVKMCVCRYIFYILLGYK